MRWVGVHKAGKDTLYGGSLEDFMDGGSAKDTLYACNGDQFVLDPSDKIVLCPSPTPAPNTNQAYP